MYCWLPDEKTLPFRTCGFPVSLAMRTSFPVCFAPLGTLLGVIITSPCLKMSILHAPPSASSIDSIFFASFFRLFVRFFTEDKIVSRDTSRQPDFAFDDRPVPVARGSEVHPKL